MAQPMQKAYKGTLLNIDNPKTVKGEKLGYLTAVQYLAPAKLSGYEVCAGRSDGCTDACLHRAGNPAFMAQKERSRIARTKAYFEDRDVYMLQLYSEIRNFIGKAQREDMTPVIRLNGTSDIPWERIELGQGWDDIFEPFRRMQFYDYTKILKRMRQFLEQDRWPANYHLTFSKSEDNWKQCREVLNNGGNVAAVFDYLPDEYEGFPVINGDADDLRFRAPQGFSSTMHKGVIVGLKAKGPARKDESGFTIKIARQYRANQQLAA